MLLGPAPNPNKLTDKMCVEYIFRDSPPIKIENNGDEVDGGGGRGGSDDDDNDNRS